MTAAVSPDSFPLPCHFPREGTLRAVDTGIHVWEEQVEGTGMRAVLRDIVGRLKFRGWTIGPCPETARRFPTISADTRRGRKGDLEIRVQLRGRHLELLFFQNVVIENKNGGEYDFQKFKRMPRAMQFVCILEMTAVLSKLRELGYAFGAPAFSDPLSPLAVRDALAYDELAAQGTIENFNRHWSASRFKRDESGWPAASEISACWGKDRDGIPVLPGEVRCARLNGRLVRGVARGGINGWWYLGAGVGSFETSKLFFCAEPAREPRRFFPDQAERLHRLIEKETKAKNYRRVAAISAALARIVAKRTST